MKKILLLLMLLPLAGFAQHFAWLNTPETLMPYNPDMVGYSTTADADGNIYYTGFKDTPFIYNSIMGSLYFNKYDTNGNLLFSNGIGGQAQSHDMVTDSQGNVYIALSYVGSIILENVALITANQSELYLFAKFSPQGDLLWYHELLPADMGDNWYNEISELKTLALDSQDNLYIGYADFFKSYVEKYTPAGALAQTITQDNVRRITSIAVDNEDNIYTAGSCIGLQANFNGTNITTDLPYSVYVAKYSAAGESQWVKIVEDITCPAPRVVAKTPDAVYFSSYLAGPYPFDDLMPEGDGIASEQFFLTKLNAQGQYQWLRQTPNSCRFALGNRNFLALDIDGNVFLGGNTSGTTNWGNGIITSIQTYSLRGAVVKYDAQGTVQMAKIVGGSESATSITRFDGITITNNGDIITAGMGFGTANFDEIAYDPEQDTAYYPFITKLTQTAAGVNDISKNNITLYPNPANGKIYVDGLNTSVKASIINTLGQKVQDVTLTPQQATDVSALPAGAYILQAEGIKAIKFIKL